VSSIDIEVNLEDDEYSLARLVYGMVYLR